MRMRAFHGQPTIAAKAVERWRVLYAGYQSTGNNQSCIKMIKMRPVQNSLKENVLYIQLAAHHWKNKVNNNLLSY